MSEPTGATAASAATDATDVESALPPAPPPGAPLLEIKGLKKYFPLTQGVVFQRTVGFDDAFELSGAQPGAPDLLESG